MFSIINKFLFNNQISSFIYEAKKVVSDGKTIMSYLIEDNKIIFFFVFREKIIFFKKEKNSPIEIKEIKFEDILLQEYSFIKTINLSKNTGEIVEPSETIYFLFNFINNIKNQFLLSVFEQSQLIESILEQKDFFNNNLTVMSPEQRYNWVD